MNDSRLITANDRITAQRIANLNSGTKLYTLKEYPTELLLQELSRRTNVTESGLKKVWADLQEVFREYR